MLKISDAVREIITNHPFLSYGFQKDLLNLSQVARFIKPLVEARTKKEVQESAVLMSISRLKERLAQESEVVLPEFFLDKVSVHSNLCSLTLVKTETAHRALNRLFATIQERHGFLTITEGMSEITAIFDEEHYEDAMAILVEKPRLEHRSIASVTAKFHRRFLNTRGLLYRILHQVTMQNINLVEVASTATEFSIFIHQSDVELAFDSIYRAYIRRAGRSPSAELDR